MLSLSRSLQFLALAQNGYMMLPCLCIWAETEGNNDKKMKSLVESRRKTKM